MNMDNDLATHRSISGLGDIASKYDLIFCDIWGVIHNGVRAFLPACEALVRFRAKGGVVVLVSNAPRPHGSVLPQLAGLGVPEAVHDAVVTSGDVTRGLIAERAGQLLHHVGPERDLPLFDGLDAPRTGIEEARYAVCTGLREDEHETAADYADELSRLKARGLPMICANPDLVVDRGGREVPCAGAIGAAYEALGGAVIYPGKPWLPIYQMALDVAERHAGRAIVKDRILGIGDAIRTDIAGADAFGVASLLVLDGIHAAETGLPKGQETRDARALDQWLAVQAHKPVHFMPKLAW
jgi:HAD superfamily hydrolase (TIGR01459 family)